MVQLRTLREGPRPARRVAVGGDAPAGGPVQGQRLSDQLGGEALVDENGFRVAEETGGGCRDP